MTADPQSLRVWLRDAVTRLAAAGVDQADADAVWLACHFFGVSRGELEVRAATDDAALDASSVARLEELVVRRISREPLWHILEAAPFLGMELSVGPGVFSPRPETELLAHTAITELLAMEVVTGELAVWDIGAGSGAIGLAIARAVVHASVASVEPSDDATPYLLKNVERYGDGRIDVVSSDARGALSEVAPGSVDLVVSNPPYLVRGVDWVDVETGRFDPDQALYADDDGLAVMADVVSFAAVALRKGGVLVVEHGIGHNDPVSSMVVEAGFGLVSHHNDLVGRPRFTRAAKL